MASPWDAFPVVEQQPAQGRVFIPNAAGHRNDQRDQTRTDIAVEGSERDARREGREVENTAFEQAKKLRDEFNALPAVKDYGTVLKNLDIALHTSPTKAGDQDLIYALAQLRDPMGSVREGDAATIEGGQSFFQQQLARLKSELGDDGRFDPEYRNALRREAIGRLNSANRAYISARQRYRALAEQSQFDPVSIVGEHAGSGFVERFREYDRANGLGEFARQPEPSGSMRVPGATMDNIRFDIDGGDEEGPRLTPEKEQEYQAFIRNNLDSLTPERLNAWWIANGFGGIDNAEEVLAAAREGRLGGVNYGLSDEELRRAAEQRVLDELGGDKIGGNVAGENGLFPWSDELIGVRGGIESLARGGNFMDGYRDTRDFERAAVRLSEREHGAGPKIVGSLMTPAGLVSRANLARDALAIGALYGTGEGEGFADTVSKGVTGAALGYGAGKAIEAATPVIANSAIGKRVSQALSNRGQDAREFAAAAERQGLDYLPADIPGRTGTQMATSFAKATIGGVPIADAATKIVEKARAARDRIAGNVGAVADNVGAGQSAQRGMEAWERQTAGRGGQLYDAIPIKPDTPVDLSTTRQTLAELNDSISSNADLAALVRDPRMTAYQKALESGNLTWKDIKSFRSYIGEKAGRPTLQQDTSKDSLDALYGALSQDIQRAATAHSPEAAKAFTRANDYWRGRQARLNDVMTKLVGKDGNMSPEATFAQIERWAGTKGGDYASLARAIRSMPDDEANTIRATIIDRLGDASAGRQNADQSAFSPDGFLTQWANLSDRAKAVLFQGEHRKALDDLATVFDGAKFSRGFDNKSQTGLINTGLTSGVVSLADPTAGIGLAAIQYVGGKLLASPRFARWLVALGKKPNPSAQLAHVNQLTAIARSEPVIANDIFTLQERLAAEFSRSPGSLAAQDSSDGRGEPPAQGERGNAP